MHTNAVAIERRAPSSLTRYGTAMLSVLLATLITIGLNQLGCPTMLSLFYAAVVVSAWIGGFFPALAAMTLSAIASIIFIQSQLNLSVLSFVNGGQYILFLVSGLIICFMGEAFARSKAALHLSDKHYQLLFHRNLAGVVLSTLDGQLLDCNEAFAKILGYDSRKELLSYSAWDIYFERSQRESYIQKLREDGSATVELSVKGKDGDPKWIIVNEVLVEDGPGGPNLMYATVIDITERKLAEAALFASERHLSEAQRLANIGSWTWEIQTNTLNWSDELYKIFGCDPLTFTLTFEAYVELLHPDDREHVIELISSSVKNQKPLDYYKRIIRPDGNERILHARGIVITDEDGKPIRVDGAAQDVSDRYRAEIALRETEHRYRHIFENASEGIFQSTPNGAFIAANPALARMHGYDSPEDFIREMHDIPNQVYVDPTRRVEFKRLLDDYGVIRNFEHEVFRKDGTTVWISVNALAVRDKEWNIQFYEGTARDVTKRKTAEEALRRSEDQYRELFENANDAIYVHDLSGNYISVNRAAERLSGFSRQEIIGKNFVEFVSPKHLKAIRERLGEKLLVRSPTAYEIEIIAKDGHIVPVEVTSRLIYENGVPFGVQGIARDISDRRRAEALLRNFPRKLIGAQEAERRRIARELHDEIGQALTSIRINLQGVKESPGAEQIGSQLDGSLGIIDLTLNQVRDLALDLRPSLLDDLGLVAALRWYLDRETARAGLVLDLNFDLYKTRLAPESETACFRIVQEALTNIVRHAHATHVSVELILRGTEIQLAIRDDGVGFDVDAAQHRFASDASLGLQGMQERVLAVGGTIVIESSREKGTEVRARIPFLPHLSTNDLE